MRLTFPSTRSPRAPYERVWYTPYGQARHHWGQDFDGDRDFDSADTNALLNKISGGSVPITDTTHYDVEYDLNRDGTIDFNDLPSGSAQAAVPLGQLGRLDGVNTGPDNWIGYAGYVWEGASSLYHVRHRSYSPELGRWMQRDPAGYVDGMGLYEYVGGLATNAVDAFGAAKQDGRSFVEGWGYRPEGVIAVSWQSHPMATPEDPAILKAKAACEAWAKEEANGDQTWVDQLEECPCELDMTDPDSPKLMSGDGKHFKAPEDNSGRWAPYHPGATWQVRGKPKQDGSGQQCTYDEDGKLITGGASVGTPDLHSPTWSWWSVYYGVEMTRWGYITPWKEGRNNMGYLAGDRVGRHRKHDVLPFTACKNAGMLDTYFKYRPPSKGAKCDGSPCPTNEVD